MTVNRSHEDKEKHEKREGCESGVHLISIIETRIWLWLLDLA